MQLARDAQSSGDTIMAESLLQHAEHYFRLIAAAQLAQQQANGFGRSQVEAEVETDDDDDFTALPDRFAPLAERLPPTVYQAQPQPFAQQPQPQFSQPQQQPQPFEERPMGEMRVDNRQDRPERAPRPDRPPFRERNNDDRRNFDRNRDNRRFQRSEPTDEAAPGLPSFITAPPRARPRRTRRPRANSRRPSARRRASTRGSISTSAHAGGAARDRRWTIPAAKPARRLRSRANCPSSPTASDLCKEPPPRRAALSILDVKDKRRASLAFRARVICRSVGCRSVSRKV